MRASSGSTGVAVPLPLHTGQFRELGLSFVHQDLGLIPSLTVIENLWIADLSSSKYRLHIPWARVRRNARAGSSPVRRRARSVSSGLEPEAGRVRDARHRPSRRGDASRGAGARRKGLLVLDEPTVFLPKADVDRLFTLVREIVGGGDSVLFVSHDLDEVPRHHRPGHRLA